MKRSVLIGVLAMGLLHVYAQDDFKSEYEKFRQQSVTKYDNFRLEANRQYAEFMRNAWEEYKKLPAIPKPKEKEVPPVVKPKKDEGKPIDSKPVKIDDEVVTVPKVEPQPAPVEPIREQPVAEPKKLSFSWLNTAMEVRFPKNQLFTLTGCTEESVANAWEQLASNKEIDNTIRDCLALRMKHQLCDWAYLQMLDECAKACCAARNEATLLMAYLYQQSGYRMRLGIVDEQLQMLYATKHTVYGKCYFKVDGTDYYPYVDDVERMRICAVGYPKEQSLSLWVHQQPILDSSRTQERKLTSERYPDFSFVVTSNKQLIDFYNTYPTSMIDNNVMTRWAIYANTPLEKGVATSLLPALKTKIKGMSEKEAIERMLNWVQTAFVYEFDDKVWGQDRAFFAEESLYYPYCDCEDRSILFTRLVRDVLGLDCILVYYPGHLASAVAFTSDDVRGDYILLNGRRFVVCDPTYIGAPVGQTMPDMDNQKAKVILLNR